MHITCTKCKIEQPIENFSKDSRRKSGLSLHCRSCKSIIYAEYCSRNQEKERERHAKYYSENKEICQERNRRWELNNPDKLKAKKKRFRERNKESELERQRTWRENNRELSRASSRNWAKNNPGRVNANIGRRRAAKSQATPAWADKDAMQKFYDEARRLTEETGIRHDVDHVIPLRSKVVCGLHCEFNMQILPMIENAKKNNKFEPGYY